MTDLRASDAEREAVVAQLRHHAGDGRLDVEELDARTDAAYHARTRAELAALLADLPAVSPDAAPPPLPVVSAPTKVPRWPGSVRFTARWRAVVEPERAMGEFLHHVGTPLYQMGYDVVERTPDRLVFAIERRPLWIWPVLPFGFPISLVLLLVKRRTTIVVDLARAGDETLLVARGVASLPVRRAFSRLEEADDPTYPSRR